MLVLSGLAYNTTHIVGAYVIGQALGAVTASTNMLNAYFVIQCMAYGEWRTDTNIEDMANGLRI